MISNFYLVVIIVNAPGAAAPVVEQPIQKEQPQTIDLDPLRWHCPACGWWNTYSSVSGLKNGSKQHLNRCPKK